MRNECDTKGSVGVLPEKGKREQRERISTYNKSAISHCARIIPREREREAWSNFRFFRIAQWAESLFLIWLCTKWIYKRPLSLSALAITQVAKAA